jgi:Photosynthetic reaction centre cytochrome C subunit
MRWVTAPIVAMLMIAPCSAQIDNTKPKLASEVYKNLHLLGNVPADKWFSTMSFFADSLGVTCDHCHGDQFESDEKPTKIKARQMISMTRDINEKYFSGVTNLTCNSCHRGSLVPSATPVPDLDHWLRPSRAKEALPAAGDLIATYRSLIGSPLHFDSRSQAISLRMSTFPMNGSVENVESEIVIGGTALVRVTSRSEKETTSYIRNGDKGWITEGAVWRPMTEDELQSLRGDLSALQPNELGTISDPTTIARALVYDREAYVVEAKSRGIRTWLYFDAKSGLLLRKRGFDPSYFGDHTWDVEYAQYTALGKIMLPNVVRTINPAGEGLQIRTIANRRLDLLVDRGLFVVPGPSRQSK